MRNERWVPAVAGRWADYIASGDEVQCLMLITEEGEH